LRSEVFKLESNSIKNYKNTNKYVQIWKKVSIKENKPIKQLKRNGSFLLQGGERWSGNGLPRMVKGMEGTQNH
jgi:hypothetical protein